MNRFIYRCLLWLHPRSFRERFADEMLCVFDEAAPASAGLLLVDGLTSLARQWLFRSGIWKVALGAALSTGFLFGWAFIVNTSEVNELSQRLLINHARALSQVPLDKAEFNREAAAAVAMLASFRNEEAKKAHRSTTDSAPPNK